MSTIIPVSMNQVLPAIQAQVVARTKLPPNLVFFWVREGPVPPIQAGLDVVIRPHPPVPADPFFTGEGRVSPVLRRQVDLTIRVRLSLDQPDRDDAWLMDPKLGLFQIEDMCLNALEGFIPQDKQYNWLVTEPMRLSPSPSLQRPDDKDADWGRSILAFDMQYLPLVDLVNQ